MTRRRTESPARQGRSHRATIATGASVLAAALTATLLQAAAPAAADTASTAQLPGGRATYVISMMDGRPGALSVRLATYRFRTDHTVSETYWAWRQDQISGRSNVRWTKPASGLSTAGCRLNCKVRTPVGFQRGRLPLQHNGTWSIDGAGRLVVRWRSGAPTETWQLNAATGLVGARLVTSSGDRSGWGAGSRAGADGVPMAQVHAAGWVHGPFSENNLGGATKHGYIGLNPDEYSLCGTGKCMQGKNTKAADRSTWYHSYLAADPAVDGRKVFWNNQTGVVQQMESANSTCISAGGGHTNALLQVIDDYGRFAGYVGVEASLNQRKVGQDVVASYAMLTPQTLPALGSW